MINKKLKGNSRQVEIDLKDSNLDRAFSKTLHDSLSNKF